MAGNFSSSNNRLRSNLARFRQSFRDGAYAFRLEARQKFQQVRCVPKWIIVLNKAYHHYGLKHLLLIIILIIYQFIGAAIFYYCEISFDENKEQKWKDDVQRNRTQFIQHIIPIMFNNTEYLFFLTANQTEQVSKHLDKELADYEKQLGIKYTDQKYKWDFWNAMLYAQTICTTIGYGHMYPATQLGKVFTMLYAIIGIPLVLSVLDDLGKLLTRCLKTPWYFLKCGSRRIFRYCTKQTMAEIKKLDEEDKEDLEVLDLPIPVAIFVVVAWIFICSATFCIWERSWDYSVAFYFFFISLSTIGLGDITPSQPKLLLTLFIYIIIGLSLVSMCINLIQIVFANDTLATNPSSTSRSSPPCGNSFTNLTRTLAKMERTYQTGRDQFATLNALSPDHSVNQVEFSKEFARIRRQSSSLGVFRRGSSHYLSRDAVQAYLQTKKKSNKSSQTVLSFPTPTNNAQLTKSVSASKVRFLPRTLSIDDVMKLVDTEEGDILVLTELVRDESGISESSMTSEYSGSQSSQIVVSKSFDANFSPAPAPCPIPTSLSIQPPSKKTAVLQDSQISKVHSPCMNELEAIEEVEDKILLGRAAKFSANPFVHFRSRLSLIPEQQSLCDESETHDEEDANNPEETDLSSKDGASTPLQR